jgi:hypothetical protein
VEIQINSVRINKNDIGYGKNVNWWSVFTRNKLGISVLVGTIETPKKLEYEDIISQAKKQFKKEIRKINNSEFVFQSKIYG